MTESKDKPETEPKEKALTISASAFAKRIGISKDTVAALVHNGFVKGAKIGGRILIPTGEVDRFMSEMVDKEIRPLSEFKGQLMGKG